MRHLDWLHTVLHGEPPDPASDDAGHPSLDEPERYEDRGVLGVGGMGTVRQVRDLAIRRKVAVKLLNSTLSQEPIMLQTFVEEALVMGQLTHPNILPLFDLGRDARGTVYFTMPVIEGKTLFTILRDPDLPPGNPHRLTLGLEAFLKVCDAVGFAHSRGVVHRDLKTANVMVGTFGEVYVMDWGLAKVMRNHPDAVDVPRGPRSPLGRARETADGTMSYMAPEQATRFPDVDERADIFALGAMLYEIVTGKPPYVGTPEEVAELARECRFTPADVGRDFYVPRRLARVIAKAMSKHPDDRYRSAEEIATQVREFVRRGHHMPVQTFAPGARIVREGEVADCAYILTRGECEVYKTVDGSKRVLRRMRSGSIFGEAAILGEAPRSATVEAVTEVTVMVISRDDIDERLAVDTWEGLLVRTLVERFREHDAKLTGATEK
ncbi:MAG: serine/threonine-protein kinase [Polyangiaceae bacterium]